MDMSEVERLEASVLPTKASAYLRQGIELTANDRGCYLTINPDFDGGLVSACALGAAIYAKYRCIPDVLRCELADPAGVCGRLLGLPDELAHNISYSHYSGRMSREQLADMLEAMGY